MDRSRDQAPYTLPPPTTGADWQEILTEALSIQASVRQVRDQNPIRPMTYRKLRIVH